MKIHKLADVQSKKIGAGTRIWQYVVILSGAEIGEECNICSHCFIEDDVVIGNRVTIKNAVQVWNGLRIEDDVFIGPGAAFVNDRFPRSKQYPEKFAQTVLKKGCSVGANATVLSGVTVGCKAMVGAGSVVTKDVPREAMVVGNPARIIGYADTNYEVRRVRGTDAVTGRPSVSRIPGVAYIELPIIPDMRGTLSYAEVQQHLPFAPKRYFLVYDVPSREIRGEHAHRRLRQFLVCIRGSCAILVDNGMVKEEYVLDSPAVGLSVPAMVWSVQYKYSQDAMLLVLASDEYDAEDYIRDYEEYLALVNRK